jgi:hypothetical protein
VEVHTPEPARNRGCRQVHGRQAGADAQDARLSGDGPSGSGPAREGIQWVVAVVRGDHDANEGKVKAASGCSVVMADEKAARAAGLRHRVRQPSRRELDSGRPAADRCGRGPGRLLGDGRRQVDHHVKHFNWKREIGDKLDDPVM